MSAARGLDRLLIATQPPRGVAISITERRGTPNWVAGFKPAGLPLTHAFASAVQAMRTSEPLLDWSAVPPSPSGGRRLAKWLSEIEKP